MLSEMIERCDKSASSSSIRTIAGMMPADTEITLLHQQIFRMAQKRCQSMSGEGKYAQGLPEQLFDFFMSGDKKIPGRNMHQPQNIASAYITLRGCLLQPCTRRSRCKCIVNKYLPIFTLYTRVRNMRSRKTFLRSHNIVINKLIYIDNAII